MLTLFEETKHKDIEDWVSMYLEDYSLEDLLEMFDITPEQAFLKLFEAGLIDQDLMERLL